MSTTKSITELRVRYSETDQMGTFYNSRALEWFECGRTDLMRQLGLPYTEMETRGVFLPLVGANVKYLGRAKYDDLLKITTTAQMAGKARIRFEIEISQYQSGSSVANGYTVHAIADKAGKPIRPPAWFVELFAK